MKKHKNTLIATLLVITTLVITGCSVSVDSADKPDAKDTEVTREAEPTQKAGPGKENDEVNVHEPSQKSEEPTKEPTKPTQEPTPTPAPEPTAEVISWERRYIQKGKENASGYDPFIVVEYYNNGKREYVKYILEYKGTMVYMQNPDNAKVPQSGYTYISDYSNNQMEPELTDVYLDYSDSEIKLYFYNKSSKTYSDTPVDFYYMTDDEIRERAERLQKMIDDATGGQ